MCGACSSASARRRSTPRSFCSISSSEASRASSGPFCSFLIPYVAATGGVSLGTLDARGWVCLLIVGFFHTGVTYCLYFSALRELPGQEVALLSYMDPLVAVIVSVTVLGEPVTAPQLVGGFTLWNELPEKK